MKASNYNFFYKYRNNCYLIYNSWSNALAIMSNYQYNCFQQFQADLSYKLDDKFVNELQKGNFIIEDEVNELDLIRERMLKYRYNSSTLGLTIAPTLDCNFRCIYCYEKGCNKNGVMPEEVQNKIIEYIRQRASTINQLTVTWYGGEPLLALEIIENLTNHFLEICYLNNINYSASIVTNGYLLSSNVAKRLADCKIVNCQVTIDGDRETHNIRRPHVMGIDTYDVILHNAFTAGNFFPVAIRVNVDKENINAIFSIRKDMDRKGISNVVLYPAPVRVNNDCYGENICLNSIEFYEFEYQYVTSIDDKKALRRKYPIPRGNSCCADSLNALVISEDGSLYKCWSDIGRKDLCIGNIVDGCYNATKAIRYSKYDPTQDRKCSKCKFLPICMGGCPRDVYNRPEDRCAHIKKIHKMYISRIALDIEQKENVDA